MKIIILIGLGLVLAVCFLVLIVSLVDALQGNASQRAKLTITIIISGVIGGLMGWMIGAWHH